MKIRKISLLLQVLATTVGIVSITGQGAQAFDLKQGTTFNVFLECLNDGIGLSKGANPTDANGWQYAVDSNTDGMNGNYWVGAAPGKVNPYDISGLAVKETATSVIVALNGNMKLSGQAESGVTDGQIGWGDLFFNMSGKTFDDAMSNGDLLGIRFSSYNASGASQLGVYSNVQAKTVTDLKDGYTVATYGGLAGGSNSYESQVKTGGGTVSYGDLTSNYFTNNGKDKTFNLNEIASGNYLTGISFLAQGDVTKDLLATGYDSSKFKGSQTIAFEFSKSALPGAKSVPESSALAGLAVISLALVGSQRRKSNQST